jgi:putative sigma-54 modulation protein
MKLNISFKNLDHTASLDERIREKSEKLNKYFSGRFDLHWTCYVENDGHHVDLKVLGPKFNFQSSTVSDSMYKSLDKAIQKLERQISRQKFKRRDKINKQNLNSPKSAQIGQQEADEKRAIELDEEIKTA